MQKNLQNTKNEHLLLFPEVIISFKLLIDSSWTLFESYYLLSLVICSCDWKGQLTVGSQKESRKGCKEGLVWVFGKIQIPNFMSSLHLILIFPCPI